MHFMQVHYSRIQFDHVRRAIVSVPYIKNVVYDGEEHRIIDYMDIKVMADGKAYDMKGNRLSKYDLNLTCNDKDYIPRELIPGFSGAQL